MLEVIDKGSSTESHPVPLLFVHGGYHAAWCWDENFLDYFVGKGFRAVAVSLRGHGRSTLSKHRDIHCRSVRFASRRKASRSRADSSGPICCTKCCNTKSGWPPPSSASRISRALCCSRDSVGQYR
jgi:pimeloyl-ACP methyl ester carboxylesterase